MVTTLAEMVEDAITTDALDLIARAVIVNGMLSDQPLPLQGPRLLT
jgi:hypothetical protein